mgnify:CR=1 FL=1
MSAPHHKHHDTGYKELFSYPEFVQQLIEGFAPPDIAQLMDFTQLKQHSSYYITPMFEEKIEDVVWSVEVTWEGITQEVYLYILLEFQSSVDHTMPIRMMHYVACFYSELLKQKVITPSQGLPPSFPSCFTTVPILGHLRWIFLIWYSRHRLLFFSGIFGVENAGESWATLQTAVDRIVTMIQADPHKERIDKVITRWIKRHLYRLDAEINIDQLTSLVEDKEMLAENLENLVQKERQTGRLEGRQEGRQEAEQRALESKRNAARKLIALTEMSDQLIADIEELPVEEVEKLRAETQH